MSEETKMHIQLPNEEKKDSDVLPEYIPTEGLKNGKWTYELEDYLNKIGKISMKYKKIHNAKAKYYIRKYNTAMYTSIMLSPLVGMLSAVNISIGDYMIIPIVILCVSFLNGIIMSVIKFRRWDEESNQHKTSAAKYAALASSAKRQLTLTEKNRENPDDYIQWITNVFNKIFLTSPIIDAEDSELEIDTLNTVKKNSVLGDYPIQIKVLDNTCDIKNKMENHDMLISDPRFSYEMNRLLNH